MWVATAVLDNTGYLQGPVAVMGLCLETETQVEQTLNVAIRNQKLID